MRGDDPWSGRRFWVVEVVLLLVGSIGFFGCMGADDTWTLWRHGEHRLGVVDHVEWDDRANEHISWVRLGDLGLYRFTYEVDERPGETVEVVIDPDDLETANLWQATRGLLFWAFFLAALPVAWPLFVRATRTGRRLHRESTERVAQPQAPV